MPPKDYRDAGAALVAGGVLNALTGGLMFIGLVWFCVGVLWLIPATLGIVQAVVGWKMHQGQIVHSGKTWGIIGLVSGLCNLNPLATVASAIGMTKAGSPDSLAFTQG